MTEPERHELYQAFEGLFGKKKAETMMALLPPVGWGDVATRRDIEAIHRELDAIHRELDKKADKRDLETMKSELNAQIMRTALTVNIPTLLAGFALAFAAVRLG